MRPRNDERRPGQGGASSGRPSQRRATYPAWHAFATVYRVVGTRGRQRSVIVVDRCPYCRLPHVHTGKPDFDQGKRTASCHAGRYLVHTHVLEGEAVAS